MTKTWEDRWPPGQEEYWLRVFEDIEGGGPPVFVVQRLDNQPLDPAGTREFQNALESTGGYPHGESRFWEQTPEGRIYEHTHTPYQFDANPIQHDLPPGEYDRGVAAGDLRPDMRTGYNHGRTEISAETAREITGHEILSPEQEIRRELEQLRGPAVSHD